MTTVETTEREGWYAVEGYPEVFFDGGNPVLGAGVCEDMIYVYRQSIEDRFTLTGGMSPVGIEAHMTLLGDSVQFAGDFRLVDSVQLTNLRATFLLYEDNVEWCCAHGIHTWQHTTRAIRDRAVTLTNPGDEALFEVSLPIDPAWRKGELRGVAYLQDIGTKEIIQGKWIEDFRLEVEKPIASTRTVNRVAEFRGCVRNRQLTSQAYTVQAGSTFGDWPAFLLVGGDETPHADPVRIVVAPGDSCAILLRVVTGSDREIRSGSLDAACEESERSVSVPLRVFNGSPAILLVDNDAGHTYEEPLERALDVDAYLYDHWDVFNDHNDATPRSDQLNGYDIVVWHTADYHADVCSEADRARLTQFMDHGGALFMTSQYFLNSLGGGMDAFVSDYLGVASYSLDRGYEHLSGIPGDPIGDAMDLRLQFDFPSFRKGDDALPGPRATTCLVAEDGSHAMIRATSANGAKSVFLPERFDAISETDADPNNSSTVVRRVVEWLMSELPAVIDGPGVAAALQPAAPILRISPNPSRAGAEILFTIPPSAVASQSLLEVFNAAGRAVAVLARQVFTAGVHRIEWNGLNAGGTRLRAGVYFVRLTTSEGARTVKIVIVR